MKDMASNKNKDSKIIVLYNTDIFWKNFDAARQENQNRDKIPATSSPKPKAFIYAPLAKDILHGKRGEIVKYLVEYVQNNKNDPKEFARQYCDLYYGKLTWKTVILKPLHESTLKKECEIIKKELEQYGVYDLRDNNQSINDAIKNEWQSNSNSRPATANPAVIKSHHR
jgi:hypothetical protein